MIGTPSKLLGYGLSLALSASSIHAAGACTRVLYAGDDGLIIAGRSMDWNYDTRTNLWVFPAACSATAPQVRIRRNGLRNTAA